MHNSRALRVLTCREESLFLVFWVNKIVSVLLSPLAISLILLICSLVYSVKGKKRFAIGFLLGTIIWLWGWSTGCTLRYMAKAIEQDFIAERVEDVPKADAIVVLGGGIGVDWTRSPYPELYFSGDRAWHAARLWKAGCAPLVVVTGVQENDSSRPFLVDLGVADEFILVESEARNTEDNAKFTEKLLCEKIEKEGKIAVLLVTSAWHMRRSLFIFRKYAPNIEVIPVAADFEMQSGRDWPHVALCPTIQYFFYNSYLFKEMIGYWGYCLRGGLG